MVFGWPPRINRGRNAKKDFRSVSRKQMQSPGDVTNLTFVPAHSYGGETPNVTYVHYVEQ